MKRLITLALILLGCTGQTVLDAQRYPQPSPLLTVGEPAIVRPFLNDSQCRAWVDSVMETLSLEERIGQLFIYTIAPTTDQANKALLQRVVRTYKVGGLLFSGGKWANQVALTNEAQRLADVPLLLTFDGEWGLSMRLKGMPTFPRNMVLGCITSDSLIRAYGAEMARECREMGVQVNFAPVADVNINPRNPVIGNRSFGERPENVARKVSAYAEGLEAGGVLAVCKHFPGHGDTEVDSHKALPTLPFSRERMDSIELTPFRQAIRAGVGGIMVGHLEVPAIDPRNGRPASLSSKVVTDILKDELGFKGLVFTDALSMRGAGAHDSLCLQALRAGHDLLLTSPRIKQEMASIVSAVKRGTLSRRLIDEKCRKVLTYKYALGLMRKPSIHLSGLESRIHTPATDSLISRLHLAAITLVCNRNAALPFDPTVEKVAVLCLGNQSRLQPFLDELERYAHPATFQLTAGMSAAARQQLQRQLKGYRRILVAVSDRQTAPYRSFFDGFRPEVPVVVLGFVTGDRLRPMQDALAASDALLLAHSTREDVQRRVARILYGDAPVDGRLSMAIGLAFAAGEGVTLSTHAQPRIVPEDHGMKSDALAGIDSIALEGIRKKAYPGCQIVVLKDGEPVYDKTFGTHTYPDTRTPHPRRVHPTDLYDIASLTKTTATLLAVMKLYDQGKLNLTDRLGDYLPFLQGTDKADITVRDLLLHESGLPSTLPFYLAAIDKESYPGTLFRSRRDAHHTVRIGQTTWANPRFRFRQGLTSSRPSETFTLQVCDSLWLHRSFRDSCLQQIADARLLTRRYRYSCVGFILLQQLVETRTGTTLDRFLRRTFYEPMHLKHIGFHPLQGTADRTTIVPSAADPFLRKEVLQGFVHDESAAFLGGVAGNAGLFASAEEVAKIGQLLLNDGEWEGHRYLSPETCRLFTTTVSRLSRRGLGFDKPDPKAPDRSPCSPSTPASVYGHTGFTGTCAWIDPDNRMVYVFLCNRTYPDSWNNKLMQLDIRTRIQELLYESMR